MSVCGRSEFRECQAMCLCAAEVAAAIKAEAEAEAGGVDE